MAKAAKRSASAETSENVSLWNELVTTPPEYLKDFKRAGGFAGKSIDPVYRVRRLTEMFGPVGKGWGVVQEDQWSEAGSGAFVVYVRGHVWWRDTDGTVYQTNSHTGGTVADRAPDEVYKMAETDALGKCALDLGLAADVYMGEHDGDKYQRPESGPAYTPQSGAPANRGRSTAAAEKPSVRDVAATAITSAQVGSVSEEIIALTDEVAAHAYSKRLFSRLMLSTDLPKNEIAAISERMLTKRAEVITEAMLPNLSSTAQAFVKQGWVSAETAGKIVTLCERKLGIPPEVSK